MERSAVVIASYKKQKLAVFVDEIPKNRLARSTSSFCARFNAKRVDGASYRLTC